MATIDQPEAASVRPDAARVELLAGEDPDTTDIQEVVHWISVYSDLVAVKQALLQDADLRFDGASLSPPDGDPDQRRLEHEVAWCRDRLCWWRRRARQLIGA